MGEIVAYIVSGSDVCEALNASIGDAMFSFRQETISNTEETSRCGCERTMDSKETFRFRKSPLISPLDNAGSSK
jgi:hypothetical protein